MNSQIKGLMGRRSVVNGFRATTKINLSAMGVALIILIALWIIVAYLSEIPRMIAASMADYLGLLIG
jgi:hypothetical protein